MRAAKEPPLVIDVRVDGRRPLRLQIWPNPCPCPWSASRPKAVKSPPIELSGVVRIGPSGRPRYPVSVIVASGDCNSPSSRCCAAFPFSDTDSFFVVVMADPGEQLTVCAASEPSPGLPTPIWVKVIQSPSVRRGERAVSNLSLVLRSARAKTFSTAARKK